MVRGRRVRTLVDSVKNNDSCNSPKRKDQRLDFSAKLSHVIVSPNHLVKNQSITDFFQVVHDDENRVKNYVTESFLDACHKAARENLIQSEICEEIIEIEDDSGNESVCAEVTSTTPHRIELCSQETQGSPTSALSQLHIATFPKRTAPPKARRRLNTNVNNKEILKASKDDSIKNATSNHTLTEYFPVRRSVRKTKRTVLEEKQRTLEESVRNKIEDGLEIHNFPGKGRGIVAVQSFAKGDYVVEYYGELIDMAEAKRRELKYAQDQNTGCYMYYFKHKNQQYCVDATAESGRLGRLVNHSRNGNLMTRTLTVDSVPRLVLLAKDDIQIGDEVTYDYGDRSRESLKYHPWLAS